MNCPISRATIAQLLDATFDIINLLQLENMQSIANVQQESVTQLALATHLQHTQDRLNQSISCNRNLQQSVNNLQSLNTLLQADCNKQCSLLRSQLAAAETKCASFRQSNQTTADELRTCRVDHDRQVFVNLRLQEELAKNRLTQTARQTLRLEKERNEYKEKSALRQRRVDQLERELAPFKAVFSGTTGGRFFNQIVSVKELDTREVTQRVQTRMEMLDLLSLALSMNVLNSSRLIWDLIYSQIKFFTVKSFHGPVVFHKLFSPRLLLFLDKYYAKCGRAPYDLLRGMGSDGDDETKHEPISFQGFIWLPHARTMQKRFADSTENLQYIGYDDTIGKLIAARFHEIQLQAQAKGRAVKLILGTDEKDIGIVTVVVEVIKGRKRVRGTQDYGGFGGLSCLPESRRPAAGVYRYRHRHRPTAPAESRSLSCCQKPALKPSIKNE
ncbi:hypothetical protein BDR26DRAFT_895705 [Obelidium mucronatum]|nr:hypothetical protein BDR26DRAFT_895705 [Obelidium mucronatum]